MSLSEGEEGVGVVVLRVLDGAVMVVICGTAGMPKR